MLASQDSPRIRLGNLAAMRRPLWEEGAQLQPTGLHGPPSSYRALRRDYRCDQPWQLDTHGAQDTFIWGFTHVGSHLGSHIYTAPGSVYGASGGTRHSKSKSNHRAKSYYSATSKGQATESSRGGQTEGAVRTVYRLHTTARSQSSQLPALGSTTRVVYRVPERTTLA